MANVRSANSYYVDSTGTLAVLGLSVYSILLTSNGGAGTLVLQDNATVPVTKLTLKVLNTESTLIDFNLMPITFPNGIKVSTLTTALATIVFKEANR